LPAYLTVWSVQFGTPPDPLRFKQFFWDQPIATDHAQVQSCHGSPFQQATFMAATARHSGDWLFALPIASSMTKQ